jgi:benzoyl-CoA reductase/2-hydroxyglutaryl-CoA dehydratase subunit BcrC/BadD/HgdB
MLHAEVDISNRGKHTKVTKKKKNWKAKAKAYIFKLTKATPPILKYSDFKKHMEIII